MGRTEHKRAPQAGVWIVLTHPPILSPSDMYAAAAASDGSGSMESCEQNMRRKTLASVHPVRLQQAGLVIPCTCLDVLEAVFNNVQEDLRLEIKGVEIA